VLVLDSSAYRIPSDAIARAVWYVVNGRMVHSIVTQYLDNPDVFDLLEPDGDLHYSVEVDAVHLLGRGCV
jgi:hypothetical protein